MITTELSTGDAGRAGAIAAATAHGPVVVRGWWTAERCAELALAVLAAEPEWTRDFAGVQHCLGRAWYTHLETDQARTYFAEAPAANAVVERVLPGMQAEIRALLALAVGAPVQARRGWCGPGVHIFPAGGWCARVGGEVHFDDEGLTRAQLRARAPALSLVLMLQAPTAGGGLTVWDATYAGDEAATEDQLAAPRVTVDYGAGDLVVFDSYRLHQIQPFAGDRHRISVTAHAARAGAAWECWF